MLATLHTYQLSELFEPGDTRPSSLAASLRLPKTLLQHVRAARWVEMAGTGIRPDWFKAAGVEGEQAWEISDYNPYEPGTVAIASLRWPISSAGLPTYLDAVDALTGPLSEHREMLVAILRAMVMAARDGGMAGDELSELQAYTRAAGA